MPAPPTALTTSASAGPRAAATPHRHPRTPSARRTSSPRGERYATREWRRDRINAVVAPVRRTSATTALPLVPLRAFFLRAALHSVCAAPIQAQRLIQAQPCPRLDRCASCLRGLRRFEDAE